jgi:hypothetical protein
MNRNTYSELLYKSYLQLFQSDPYLYLMFKILNQYGLYRASKHSITEATGHHGNTEPLQAKKGAGGHHFDDL